MKTFAAALLALTAYGSQTEASAQLTTGATAEIEAAVESLGYGGLGYGNGLLTDSPYSGLSLSASDLYDSYSSDYSLSDYYSSDYSDHDYGYGYRRRYGRRIRYFRYRPRYSAGRYLYGRRYASPLGVYRGAYANLPYRSYGYGYRGLHGGYRSGLGLGLRRGLGRGLGYGAGLW